MSKFDAIKANQTGGPNYDVGVEDVIEKLEQWDARYGIEISDVTHDSVVVEFGTLPDNVESLAKEIYEFCPDVIDQGFGCMGETVEMMEESGQALRPDLAELIEGVDLEDENYGEVLLQRSLKSTNKVGLWWD